MQGIAVIGFFMIVVGIPIVAVFGVVAYSRWLRHRQLQLLLEERRLLIERGVTDLPPLKLPELPSAPAPRVQLRNLKAGIILLFVAGALAIGRALGGAPFGGSQSDDIGLMVILAALGLALIVVHYIAQAYERREPPEQETLGQENTVVVDIDTEE